MKNSAPDLERLVATVVDHGFQLHDGVGPGMLETAYETFLAASLRDAGYLVEQQLSLPAVYRGHSVENAFRIDLLIEKALIVEIKSVEKLAAVHTKQLLTYLRFMKLPVGLLINFGAPMYSDAVKRVIDNRNPYRPRR